MRRCIKVMEEYDLSDPEDKKRLLDLIDKFVPSNTSNTSSSGGGQKRLTNSFEPASPKQKELMTKLGIKWDENTSKAEATRLISEKLEGGGK